MVYSDQGGYAMKKSIYTLIVMSALVLMDVSIVVAHCDTMDGPVVGDARKALEKNNVNYVLKWVLPENEKEINQAFSLVKKVRPLSREAKELSEKYFFETVVRLHRSGEGIPYSGIKPSGIPVDKRILAADRSIELGNLNPLEKLVPKEDLPELNKRFKKVMAKRNFDISDVKAGREYVEAYVQFFHFAEGQEKGRDHEPNEHVGHSENIP